MPLKKVNQITLTVSMDSPADGPCLLRYFMEHDDTSFGDWTNIIVEKGDTDTLTMVVESINGERDE